MKLSDPVLVALISGLFGLMQTLIYLAILAKFRDTKASMDLLEKNTNSKMDELLKVTASAEFAKGVKHEQERGKS